MSRLKEIKNDPVFKPYYLDLCKIVENRERVIQEKNKKGIALSSCVDTLPVARPSIIDIQKDCIQIGVKDDLSTKQRSALRKSLLGLKPWRKGPFDLFGTLIQSEWNSSLKWNRLKDHIALLEGKRVLDIGCSCGYYMFKMAAQKPLFVMGVEPYLNFYFQYQALERYLGLSHMACLPLTYEELPEMRRCFDTIFCMGILYHRRSVLDSLAKIHANLVAGGELILETLIIEGDEDIALFPKKRYAKMNNVYFLPTVSCLGNWLERSGFENIRCVDISRTTQNEQKKTKWIDTESLEDFLDPENPLKTVEGYPAPVRAIMIANARQA